jgi:hypothetical protein
VSIRPLFAIEVVMEQPRRFSATRDGPASIDPLAVVLAASHGLPTGVQPASVGP